MKKITSIPNIEDKQWACTKCNLVYGSLGEGQSDCTYCEDSPLIACSEINKKYDLSILNYDYYRFYRWAKSRGLHYTSPERAFQALMNEVLIDKAEEL